MTESSKAVIDAATARVESCIVFDGRESVLSHSDREVAATVLDAITKPELGPDRMVRIGDVVEALKHGEGRIGYRQGPYWSTAAEFVERTFTKEA